MHVVIFEGSRWDMLLPHSLTRPVFMLSCGATTLLEKQIRYLNPSRLTLWVRPEFAEYTRQRVVPRLKVPTEVNTPLDEEPALLVAARTLYLQRAEMPTDECIIEDDGQLVRKAYVTLPGLSPQDCVERSSRWMSLFDLPHTMEQALWVGHTWDLIRFNEEALLADSITPPEGSGPLGEGDWHAVEPSNILAKRGVKIGPGAVLDASRGPILIGESVSIGANAVIEGPCSIGDYSKILPLTMIHAGTTIGAVCTIGGTVERSIIGANSHKPFEGYVGDSYIGHWCKLGAGTTTADTKTTYNEVAVQIGSRSYPTSMRALGAAVGDHTKTSICTRLVPGCYVGAHCMLVGSGLVPRFVPSFSFWKDSGVEEMDVEKALEVSRRVLDELDRKWNPIYESTLRTAAELAKRVER